MTLFYVIILVPGNNTVRSLHIVFILLIGYELKSIGEMKWLGRMVLDFTIHSMVLLGKLRFNNISSFLTVYQFPPSISTPGKNERSG